MSRAHYTPTYQSWQAMRQRCNNPKHLHFNNYGGKGVTVCDEWNDYEKFLSDMGPRPPGCSIDRIDNSKGYSKDNCQWATRTEQSRKRSNVRFITYNGKTKCLAEWCSELKLNYARVYARLFKMKWSVEDAFCI